MNREPLTALDAAARNLVFNLTSAPEPVLDVMFADPEFASSAREQAALMLAGPYGSFIPVDSDLEQQGYIRGLEETIEHIENIVTPCPDKPTAEFLCDYVRQLLVDIQGRIDEVTRPAEEEQLDLFQDQDDGLASLRQLFEGLGFNVQVFNLGELSGSAH